MSCSTHVGKNYQIRMGPPNPKTVQPPVIPPPIYEFEHWRDKPWLLFNKMNADNVSYSDGSLTGENMMPWGDPSMVVSRDVSAYYSSIPKKLRGPAPVRTLQAGTQVNDTFFQGQESPHGDLNASGYIDYYTFGKGQREMDNHRKYHHINEQSPPVQKFEDYSTGYLRPRNAVARGYAEERPGQRENFQMVPPQNGFPGTQVEPIKQPYEEPLEFSEDTIIDYPVASKCKKDGDTDRYLLTQTLQPNIYSRQDIIEPINNNLGISITPQFQPVEIEVGPVGENEVSFVRYDPQFIRDNEDPNRITENPQRNRWTAKMAPEEAWSTYVDPSEIYDPRLTGYGDPYRSYEDVNLGQIRYYYSDVDAYRRPNYVIRSKVDHLLFQDPMGAIKPEYVRNVLDNNVRELTNQKYIQDDLWHREDISERQMRKRNSEMWQLKLAPITKWRK